MKLKISWREFWKHKVQLVLYVFSLAFSLGVFLALDSVQVGVNNYINDQKLTLVGGDIIVESNRAYEPQLKTKISEMESKYGVESAEIYEFSSMAASNDNAVLAQVKIVSPNYPLFGEVELASGEKLSTKMMAGKVVVAQNLLDQLGIAVGDKILLGNTELEVSDVIIKEPDGGLNLFNFGPRILVAVADLEAIGLVGEKSRVSYHTNFKFQDRNDVATQATLVTEELTPFIEEPAEIESAEDEETTLTNFSDRFLLFLKLIIFSLLILTGIGIVTLLKAFLQSQRQTIAIRKSVGETGKSILWSYLLVFELWTLVGITLAIGSSFLIIAASKSLLAPVLPPEVTLSLSLVSIGKTVLIGVITSLMFGLFALVGKTTVKPAELFRISPTIKRLNFSALVILLLGMLIYILFVYWELANIWWSAAFVALIGGIYLLFWGLAQLALLGIKKLPLKNLKLRLVARSLNRAGSATAVFLGVFTLSVTVLFTLILIENTIQRQFILSYPEDAPNMFLLDIQKENKEELENIIGNELNFYPIIRAQLETLNGRAITEISEESGSFVNLTRSFNLTYYQHTLADEEVIAAQKAGKLYGNYPLDPTLDGSLVPVSVMDDIAVAMKAQIGDRLNFNIQGVPIEAKITSIRRRLEVTPRPFFYFVFPTAVLENAPQTLFATTKIPQNQISQTQVEIVKRFPHISLLDTSNIGAQVGGILRQLSLITSFFSLFNLIVGFIIFVASLMATSQQRKEEAVYYRLQGMTIKDVWSVVVRELIFVGAFVTLIAITAAYGLSWFGLSYLFDLQLSAVPLQVYFYGFALLVTVLISGYVVLRKPMKVKPINFIRQA